MILNQSDLPARRRGPLRSLLTVAGVGLVAILLGISAGLFFLLNPYLTIEPGDAPDVVRLVRVEGQTYRPRGSIHLVTVIVGDAGPLDLMRALLSREIDAIPRSLLYPPGTTREQIDLQNAAAMDISQYSATIAALRELGHGLEADGALIRATLVGTPAAQHLLPGDVIVAVDGLPVVGVEQLRERVGVHKVGEQLRVTVRRGDETIDLDLTTVESTQEEGRPVIGVEVLQSFRLPVPLSIDAGRIGGPSAGLAFALTIYELLDPGDLTGGRVVAVSGEIDPAGGVRRVGGVRQKIAAAKRVGAEVFILSADDLVEARGAAGSDLEVIGVKSLSDTITALRMLPAQPGTPVPGSVAAASSAAQMGAVSRAVESVSVPLHFVSTFLMVMAAAGGVWLAVARPSLVPGKRGGRTLLGVGFALLAVAEASHGSLVIASELDQGAVALRASGYAALVVALLPPTRRRSQSAAAAVTTPSLALMPALLSLAGAWLVAQTSLPRRRPLAVSFVLLAGSEAMFGLGGADLGRGGAWFLAHGLRIAAAASLGSWLWEAFRTSVRIRFVASYMLLLLLAVVLISGATTQVFSSNVRSDALVDAAQEGGSQQEALEGRVTQWTQVAKFVAGSEFIRREVAGRLPALADRARAFQAPGGILEGLDFIVFVASDGSILAYSAQGGEGAPPGLDDLEATSMAGTAVVASALRGVEAGSIDVIGAGKFAVVGAFPVLNPPGVDPPGSPISVAGAVALGQMVDASYLAELKGRRRVDFSLISPDTVVATTLPTAQELVRPDLAAVFADREVVSRETDVAGATFFSSYVPLERSDGRVVGALVVSIPSQVLELTQRNVSQILFVIVLAAAAVALVSSYVTGSRITRPLLDLTQAAGRVRGGDLDARVDIGNPDEIGALGEAFNEMTESIGRLTGDLRRTAEELETVLQSMADGVVAVDAGGRVSLFNREAQRIIGVSAAHARGRPITEVLRAVDARGAPLDLPIHELRAGSTTDAFVTPAGDGIRTPVAITSAPIEDDRGEVGGAVAVLRDLTPELEVERMKTEFLSNISHELRTPLTPIKGFADILRRRKLARRQQVAYLSSILDSAARLERVVEMLIDVSSMEAGRLRPHAAKVDLDKATAELVSKWQRAAPKHRFERRGFRSMPPVRVDERLIPRAIEELMDNAVKFSPRGGKVGLVAEMLSSRNGEVAKISVTDQGPGISPETLAGISADFVQGDASSTREFGGLGLGLSYVRRIAEAHGGRLELNSAPGRGSRFSIVVPMGARAAPKKKSPARRTRATAKTPRTRRPGSTRSSRRSIPKKRSR